MKKTSLSVLALLLLSFPVLARASIFDNFWAASGIEDRTDSTPLAQKRDKHVDGSAFEANCQEVEVDLDEGYGVSRRERRNVCNH